MRATGTFTVAQTDPVDWTPEIAVALPAGHMHMVKEFSGDVQGRSITQFSYVFEMGTGGTYVATESFEGTVGGRTGTFAFVHSASDPGDGQRVDEFFVIVPGSGTGELAGIHGSGGIDIDDDCTHHVRFDYDIP